jgi:hypothetical protein
LEDQKYCKDKEKEMQQMMAKLAEQIIEAEKGKK